MPKRKQWITADLHLNHPNIIKYCERPWKHVKDMDAYLIAKINEYCSSNDILYHLGDMMFPSGGSGGRRRTFEYYADQLEPHVVWVKGNHDHDNLPSRVLTTMIKFGREEVFATHVPRSVTKVNLCGHEHGKFRIFKNGKQYVVNCGVDVWNYQPIQFKDVKRVIQNHKNFFSGKDDDGEQLTYMPVINERWIKKAEDYEITGHWIVDEK